MNVPLLDLKPQMLRFREDIVQALTRIVESTGYILGPEVTDFENAVAEYCEVAHGIGVSSGTDALLASLMALDIGSGDLVVTTPYTFFATVGSIVRVGALPVFVDIDPTTMNIDPVLVAEALAEDKKNGCKIKAIIPVHLFGQCADMQPLLQLAEEYGIAVIEDAAQAIGAHYPLEKNGKVEWQRAGGMGTVGCFSFFPSKNLGGIGDGGLISTNDDVLAERLRIFRNHGAMPKYHHKYIGGNFRLDPIQAAVLRIKLPHLEEWHRARVTNSELYGQLFAEAGLVDSPVLLPVAQYRQRAGATKHNFHIYNQFVIRVPERDRLREYLLAHGIGCEVYYPICLHQQECFQSYDFAGKSLPVAEQAAKESLALPVYPELSREQQRYVVETIADFYRAG